MKWSWLWPGHRVDAAESCRALEESQCSLEETRGRWHRVNQVAERAEEANRQVRSQREQNHLAEIVHKALGGEPS